MTEKREKYLINEGVSLQVALDRLNRFAVDPILFTVDGQGWLTGSLTDGDVRRGLIDGLTIEDPVEAFTNPEPRFIRRSDYTVEQIADMRDEEGVKVLPIVDDDGAVIDLLNFRNRETLLPVDAVIMAGGLGRRLRPLTEDTPKPLLKVGDKPIVEHNLDRLRRFGVTDVWMTIRYLGEQIEAYFGDGRDRNLNIRYVQEERPMGTAGALSMLGEGVHDHLLVMNSDLLTNIDFEEFYRFFLDEEADLAIAARPYQVEIPYAVMETEGPLVRSLKEKPTYTHHLNAGMYLLRREMLSYVPEDDFYDITDLIERLIGEDRRVVSFPFTGYWLDIGKHEDYQKAQEDIEHLNILS